MGRHAKGPEIVEGVPGSDEAKRRVRVVLETIGGRRSVESACSELGIGSTRFEELRTECLRGAVAALEPKPIGRPPGEVLPVDPVVASLREENERLKVELATSHAREELAIGLPHASRLKKKRIP